MSFYKKIVPSVEFQKLDFELQGVVPDGVSSSLTSAYVGMDTEVSLETASALSSAAAATFDSIVAGHVPFAKLKIYNHTPDDYVQTLQDHEPPHGLDYETGLDERLERHRGMVFGEVREVCYCDDEEAEDPIVVERMVYTRDSLGFAESRTTTISWVDETGYERPEVKVLVKNYSPDDALREGKRRRGNIIDSLMMEVGFLIAIIAQVSNETALIMGRQFLRANKDSVDLFIEASDTTILGELKYLNQEFTWLDSDVPGAPAGYTMRMLLFDRINIWVDRGVTWESV